MKNLTAMFMASVLLTTLLTAIQIQPVRAAPVNLSNNPSDSSLPHIVASGKNVYVAWSDSTPGKSDVFFRKSLDGGVIFDPIINLSNNAGDSFVSQIVASGSDVYVVWIDKTIPGIHNLEIFFRRSTDSGATWGPVINLSKNPEGSFLPHMVVSGSNVYVVWEQYLSLDSNIPDAVFLRISHDNGETFEPIVNLSGVGPEGAGGQAFPEIAVSGNVVYIVWNKSGGTDIGAHFRVSLDNGDNFDPVVNIGSLGLPTISAVGNNVYVVGCQFVNPFGLAFRVSDNNGATFSDISKIGDTCPSLGQLRIAASADDVYVAWDAFPPSAQHEVFFSVSHDKGATFSDIVNLSKTVGPSSLGDLAVSGHNVHIYWTEYTPFSPQKFDVFFRASMDNGATFSDATDLTNNGSSSAPRLAFSDDDLLIVYEDRTSGKSDVFLLVRAGGFNSTPVVDDQALKTVQNTPLTITLTGTDVDKDSLTFSTVSAPKKGVLSAITPIDSTTASITYTPNTDFAGTDTFKFKANDGKVDGNTATVTIQVFGDKPLASCIPSLATILGTEGDDVLLGTEGNDIIIGLDGNDVFVGLGGNDIICGGDGNDFIYGGNGDDSIVGGDGDDFIYGGNGDDSIYGKEGSDVISGSDGDDTLFGGDGDDIIAGGDGDDLVYGAEGNDIMSSGEGNDKLLGGIGDDVIFGGNGNDELFGGEGSNDILDGGGGDDKCNQGEKINNCP